MQRSNPDPGGSTRPIARWRGGTLTAGAIVCGLVVFWGVKGITEIFDVNDFEVFTLGARAARDRDPELYHLDSPVKGRSFLYPPMGAIGVMPLLLAPERIAGIGFTLLKLAAFVGLAWGAVRVGSGSREGGPPILAAMAISSLVVFRPFDNDFGNGQINIPIAAAALGGVWLIMGTRRGWVAGALILALLGAIKPPPFLLLGIAPLHGRWKPFFVGCAGLVVFTFVVPGLWFGPGVTRELFSDFSRKAGGMMVSARRAETQESLMEFAVFTLVQVQAGPEISHEDDKYYRVAEGVRESIVPPDPLTRGQAKMVWLALAFAGLALFLWGRQRAFGRRAADWPWDAAAICVLVILLAPMARKAHLVILLAPVAWMTCSVGRAVAARGLRPAIETMGRGGAILVVSAAALLLAADDFPVPVPGFPAPYYPGLLLACLAIMGSLFVLRLRFGETGGAPVQSAP